MSGEDALLGSSFCVASGLKEESAPIASPLIIVEGSKFLAETRADCLRGTSELIVLRTRRLLACGKVAVLFSPSTGAITTSAVSVERDFSDDMLGVRFLARPATLFVRLAALGIGIFPLGLISVDGWGSVDFRG